MSSAPKFIMSITRLCTPYRMSRILSSDNKVFEHDQRLTQSLGYRYLSNYTRILQNYNTHRRKFSVYNSAQPNASLPSQPPSSSLRWILGIALSIILPFAGNKWGPLLNIKQEVDTTVETIEEIVDIAEKVAEVVDKMAENISDALPKGGKLRKVVDVVEDVAEETAKDAQTVGDVIDKLQEVEKKVENIVETLSDKANEHPKEAKG